jgi:hypothetical protein
VLPSTCQVSVRDRIQPATPSRSCREKLRTLRKDREAEPGRFRGKRRRGGRPGSGPPGCGETGRGASARLLFGTAASQGRNGPGRASLSGRVPRAAGRAAWARARACRVPGGEMPGT